MRRASTSIVLNISEGSSRKSKTERNRYYEIARGSIIEIDSCCEIIVEENYLKIEELTELGKNIKTTFILLSKLMNS
jgi:four helix bundle protein